MVALRGSATVLLQHQAPSSPAVRKQLKLLSNSDGSLITFPTLFFSVFITLKQANAAFAEVLAGSL